MENLKSSSLFRSFSFIQKLRTWEKSIQVILAFQLISFEDPIDFQIFFTHSNSPYTSPNFDIVYQSSPTARNLSEVLLSFQSLQFKITFDLTVLYRFISFNSKSSFLA